MATADSIGVPSVQTKTSLKDVFQTTLSPAHGSATSSNFSNPVNENFPFLGPIIGAVVGGVVLVIILLLLLRRRRLRKRNHPQPKATDDSAVFDQGHLKFVEGASSGKISQADIETTRPGPTQLRPSVPRVVDQDHFPGMGINRFPYSQSPLNSARSAISMTDATTIGGTIASEVEEPAHPVLLQQAVDRMEREIADMRALLHRGDTTTDHVEGYQASESSFPSSFPPSYRR
ncbi:hypothetical protein H0H93_003879 [Arthromyces matolae]|nr:hypothetical protein H0H93_003879 [Arthromyces matolae]